MESLALDATSWQIYATVILSPITVWPVVVTTIPLTNVPGISKTEQVISYTNGLVRINNMHNRRQQLQAELRS
jgi:hypothetical protein